MIIVKLSGGLGNQLFQYAAAKRLASIHNTELKLDITEFGSDKLRSFELDHFNIQQNFADDKDMRMFRERNKFKKIKLFISNYFNKNKMIFVEERHFYFMDSILNSPDNVYLDGYWQSEKYFADITNIIRSDFTIKKPLEGINLEMAKKIKSVSSAISLHVRRGDYVSNLETNKYHGTCGLDYYHHAVSLLREKYDGAHFFVFSDDSQWVKQNLKLSAPVTFVHNSAETAYEDMRLMSMCKHNIIANSSFSWWGAWLNDNPDKMVVAPRKWFNKREINTDDLIPDSWVKI